MQKLYCFSCFCRGPCTIDCWNSKSVQLLTHNCWCYSNRKGTSTLWHLIFSNDRQAVFICHTSRLENAQPIIEQCTVCSSFCNVHKETQYEDSVWQWGDTVEIHVLVSTSALHTLSHAQPLCNPYCFSAVISFTHSTMLVVVSGLPPINITGFLNHVTCMYLHFLDSFYNNTVSSLF